MKSIRFKRIGFSLIVVLTLWITVEILAYCAYRIRYGAYYSYKLVRNELISLNDEGSWRGSAQGIANFNFGNFVEAIHPYFGFTPDPDRNGDLPISSFGFFSGKMTDPLLCRTPDKYILGIFGGSFALGIYRYAISHAPAIVGNKNLVVLNFSTGGYKQPQQLIILSYLLALGAQFDAIVNIDGFNEMALPVSENIPSGVYPFYPRKWAARVGNLIDAETIKRLGHMEIISAIRHRLAYLWLRDGLYRSPTLYILWKQADNTLSRAVYDLSRAAQLEVNKLMLSNLKKDGMPKEALKRLGALAGKRYESFAKFKAAIAATIGPDLVKKHQLIIYSHIYSNWENKFACYGPEYTPKDGTPYSELSAVWQRSSLLMGQLCAANGIRYYHFLQPNQYVPYAKSMSPAEHAIAIDVQHPYREAVVAGYPFLQAAAKSFKTNGLQYHDLTMIFTNVSEIVYCDACCHLNEFGYGLIWNHIWNYVLAGASD